MNTKSYYIKKRNNPQHRKPYYVACGQLSKTAAKRKEKSLYGFNTMLEYKTEQEYKDAIELLKSQGFLVHE